MDETQEEIPGNPEYCYQKKRRNNMWWINGGVARKWKRSKKAKQIDR